MKKFVNINFIFLLLISSLIIRVFFTYFFSDNTLVNEWGIILHNYDISGVFGYNVVLSDYHAIPKFAQVGETVLPTVFMPPLYYYFIFIINYFLGNLLNLISAVIFFQIIISLLSILLFYKILEDLEKNKTLVLIFSTIFAFFPINIYATSQISSISLQVFLVLVFFYTLLKIKDKSNLNFLIYFSIVSGLLILIRGEFFIFYFMTLIYFFLINIRNIKFIFMSIIISLIVISPYLYRNYINFNTITITKSFGYNLLKGNNSSLKVEGDSKFIEDNFNRKNLRIKTSKNYEIELDNFYKEKAFEEIAKSPTIYFFQYFKKVFSFLFLDINSSYPNYYNFFHIFPKILLSITSIIGGIISLGRKNFFQYLSIYYFTNILLFSVFFILPRYSLILLAVQLILSLNAFNFLKRKLIN